MESLIGQVNEANQTSDWLVAVNMISHERDFWEAVTSNSGHISELDLTFVTPNIWGAKNSTDAALRELHDLNKAQTVEIKLKNPDKQLSPDSERIRESIDYISRGGGAVQLKDGMTTLYNSQEQGETRSVENDLEVPYTNAELLWELVKRLLR